MSDTSSSVLDETGRPFGEQDKTAHLLDEGGRPIRRGNRQRSVRADVESWIRAYPIATLLVGVLLGYALAPSRRH